MAVPDRFTPVVALVLCLVFLSEMLEVASAARGLYGLLRAATGRGPERRRSLPMVYLINLLRKVSWTIRGHLGKWTGRPFAKTPKSVATIALEPV